MNIFCVICGDLFIGLSTDEHIYSTQCGHLFHYHCLIEWFERSKTCPQCRHKTTEKNIFRIFFNNSSSSTDTDPAVLKNTVDSLEFQLKINESKLRTLTAERDKAIKQTDGLRKEYIQSRNKFVACEQEAITLKEEVKSLKSYCKKLSEVKLENAELKEKLTGLNSVQMVLNGSLEEAECVIEDTDLSASYLQICVKGLKSRIKKLESEHRTTERDLLLCKRKLSEQTQQFSDMKKKYETMQRYQKFNANNGNTLNESSEIEFGESLQMAIVESLRPSNNESPDLNTQSTSNVYRTKIPLTKPKTTSLIGVVQPKLPMGRIPKTSSSLSAVGDDVYHPNKYACIKGVKNSKKLSASAVSGVQIGPKKFKGK